MASRVVLSRALAPPYNLATAVNGVGTAIGARSSIGGKFSPALLAYFPYDLIAGKSSVFYIIILPTTTLTPICDCLFHYLTLLDVL